VSKTSPAAPIGRLRQWKIALSLAVVGALAAPFAFGTYEAQPTYSVWVPLTAQEKENLANFLRTDDCKFLGKADQILCSIFPGAEIQKEPIRRELERGARETSHADLPKYWMMNVGIAAATAAGLFSLTFLIPMLIRGIAFLIPMLIRGVAFLARRYWRWLNA
jgi:hypothetical protein